MEMRGRQGRQGDGEDGEMKEKVRRDKEIRI